MDLLVSAFVSLMGASVMWWDGGMGPPAVASGFLLLMDVFQPLMLV